MFTPRRFKSTLRARRRSASLLAVCLIVVVTLWARTQTARAATVFVVTSTADSGPGSLRQAMVDANGTPGLDTISFQIGSGHQTIKPQAVLPVLTDPVVIDGATQPGYAGTPIIELDFSALAQGHGLSVTGGDSTLRGLVVNGSVFDGINIRVKGGNRVEGCYVGTDTSGTVARPNRTNGISISTSNNVIGGTTPATRNVISGNGNAGIDVSRFCCTGDESPIAGNVIQGNFVGVNVAGTAALPNGGEGVRVSSANANVPVTGNLIGGAAAGEGNVVSGNKVEGIRLEGFHVSGNTVQGNFVGTDATGSFAVSNGDDGIEIDGSNNVVGGASAGARNVVAANGFGGTSRGGGSGIRVSGTGHVIRGNYVGTNAAGTGLPNFLDGVAVLGSNVQIGGTGAGEGNTIAFNSISGVSVVGSAAGVSIRGNSIFSNNRFHDSNFPGLGINLGAFGVTANDANDADTGSNNLQNFPVVTSFALGANGTNVQGTLNSAASTTFTLDFYSNSACGFLGHGEGARHVGVLNVTTNAAGDASFNSTLPAALPAGQVITATATDPAGNTSEFSRCDAAAPAAGNVGFGAAFLSVEEGAGVASVIVSRTGGSTGTLNINYSAAAGTATAGADFTAAQGTISFTDGENSKTFTIPITNDRLDENNETVSLTLSTAGHADTVGSQGTATLSIIDDDPRPALSIGDASAFEGNAGTTDMTFPVTLSAVSGRAVTVRFFAEDGMATSSGGGDYQPPPVASSVTIPAGQTSATVTVKIVGDAAVESDETFTVSLSGAVNANVFRAQGTGTIKNDDGVVTTIQFTAAQYQVGEGDGRTSLTLTRGGDPSAPASIDFRTADADTFTVGCADASGAAGAAYARCDFATAVGTISFAPGEMAKTVTIPVIDDGHAEGSETFEVRLSNAAGASLGVQDVATVTIGASDAGGAANPVTTSTPFFVRQQYLDFLSREPDEAGFNAWLGVLNNCGNIFTGPEVQSGCDRIHVSGEGFFRSVEFQLKGAYAFRFYKVAFNRLPEYAEIVSDMSFVAGATQAEVFARRAELAVRFTNRQEFTRFYGPLSDDGYVFDLLSRYQLQQVTTRDPANPDTGAKVVLTRAELMSRLTAGTLTRAQVLRAVVDSDEVGAAEFDNAFVAMQYYGYLRRKPEAAGYEAWLSVLRSGDTRTMVNGFLNSAEYRLRFGQP